MGHQIYCFIFLRLSCNAQSFFKFPYSTLLLNFSNVRIKYVLPLLPFSAVMRPWTVVRDRYEGVHFRCPRVSGGPHCLSELFLCYFVLGQNF
jgi:hypothetical protein